MRKKYVIPEIMAVSLPEPIAETIGMSGDDEVEAKENTIDFFEDEESLSLEKNLWEEEE